MLFSINQNAPFFTLTLSHFFALINSPDPLTSELTIGLPQSQTLTCSSHLTLTLQTQALSLFFDDLRIDIGEAPPLAYS
ncbi:hypothetical protein Syun_010710 [Stephania yunnanensis]|uniref:Uncharacterized protein n=1 Tax=Stephania yunnanensis TaxID=152371 RepID=A0AAP0KGZ3_9MAGN